MQKLQFILVFFICATLWSTVSASNSTSLTNSSQTNSNSTPYSSSDPPASSSSDPPAPSSSHHHSSSSSISIINAGAIAANVVWSGKALQGSYYSMNINVSNDGENMFVKVTATDSGYLQIYVNKDAIATPSAFIKSRLIAGAYPDYVVSVGPCQLTAGLWYISVFALQAANATAPNATVAFDTYVTLEGVNVLDSTTQNTQFSVCCDDWKYFYFSTASTSLKDLSIVLNLVNGTTIYGVYSRVGDCPSFDMNDQSNNIDFKLNYYNLPSQEMVYIGVRGTFSTAYFTISIIQAQQPLTWQIFAIIAGILVFLIIICFIINRSKRAKQFMNSMRSRREPRPAAPPSYEEEAPASSQYPTDSYIEEQRQQQRKSARKSARKSNRRDDDDDY